jgi:hypothetical protein
MTDALARTELVVRTIARTAVDTPISELCIVHRRAHRQLADRGITVGRSDVDEYCTSLDTTGASITLVRLDDEIEQLLAAPADVAVRVFQERVPPGEEWAMARAITLAQADAIIEACGGVLLRTPDGAVAGGVGVSAGTVDEDHQVAEAGRTAFAR